MAIKVGDTIPESTLSYAPYNPEHPDACSLPQLLKTHEAFKGKKVVLFAVPGAFTPTCSENHMPEYVKDVADIKSKGVDIVACIASNDAFVMDAWGKTYNVKDNILMLSDANGEFGSAMGLVNDGTKNRMGPIRLARFAMIIDDLKVVYLGVEPGRDVTVSGAPAVEAKL
ncbi:peroxiredoxin type-2 [Coemansia interrupta]|uniref:Thioredoxin-dependent peroxiredoxin n=1 Tax=Coemansia interrupta TaxID=1126814 RepID=A0A9W8LNZ0_9FUNG|nr:peroxiredoxin type-2 [Coemansia interrupta]